MKVKEVTAAGRWVAGATKGGDEGATSAGGVAAGEVAGSESGKPALD